VLLVYSSKSGVVSLGSSRQPRGSRRPDLLLLRSSFLQQNKHTNNFLLQQHLQNTFHQDHRAEPFLSQKAPPYCRKCAQFNVSDSQHDYSTWAAPHLSKNKTLRHLIFIKTTPSYRTIDRSCRKRQADCIHCLPGYCLHVASLLCFGLDKFLWTKYRIETEGQAGFTKHLQSKTTGDSHKKDKKEKRDNWSILLCKSKSSIILSRCCIIWSCGCASFSLLDVFSTVSLYPFRIPLPT
jgi:hypothetical protein